MFNEAAKNAPNVQTFRETIGAPKARPRGKYEIHCIRFVTKETDILSPPIPVSVYNTLIAPREKLFQKPRVLTAAQVAGQEGKRKETASA